MDSIPEKALPRFPGCFVCGPDNPHGLQLAFKGFGDRVEALWEPAARHIGYAQTIHGGVLASVLDEVVIWAAYHFTGRFGVTAELNLRYKRQVNVSDAVRVIGRLNPGRGRLQSASAELISAEGQIRVSAEARIFLLSEEKTKEMLQNLSHGRSSMPH